MNFPNFQFPHFSAFYLPNGLCIHTVFCNQWTAQNFLLSVAYLFETNWGIMPLVYSTVSALFSKIKSLTLALLVGSAWEAVSPGLPYFSSSVFIYINAESGKNPNHSLHWCSSAYSFGIIVNATEGLKHVRPGSKATPCKALQFGKSF